jgi:hypothetical protein
MQAAAGLPHGRGPLLLHGAEENDAAHDAGYVSFPEMAAAWPPFCWCWCKSERGDGQFCMMT